MPAAEAISPEEMRRVLAELPGWTGSPSGLERSWRFASFAAAIGFMHGCVALVDQLNHHPEWSNVYDRISVRLRTHDAGDRVTARDVVLARVLDEQARQHHAS